MSGDQLLVYYTEYGTMTFPHNLIEHGFCNAEITLQAARDLGIDAEILAPDRLNIYLPSRKSSWTENHRHCIELLIENGFDH